ncbi:hypothetical protein [Solicola sp. PLA-1-18]|uniref:hypothetical protein n=1 Tax=Solicola sp. PLA-1-18 TaxID=3380532 RepID=UPI003B7896FA
MRRFLVAAVTAGVVVGLAAAPASAQTKTRKDKVGDAPARVDIRSVKVQNNSANFAVTVRVANVTKRKTSAVVFFGTPSGKAGTKNLVSFETIPVSKGRYKFAATKVDADGQASEFTCAGAGVTIKGGANGYFRVKVPQSCLGADAGTQRTQVFTYDKQEAKGQQQSGRLLRGDEGAGAGDDISSDTLRTPITTRRG